MDGVGSMGHKQTGEPRKQTLGGAVPGGPADLSLRLRPKGHEDHAVVGMEAVKTPLLHSQPQTNHRKVLTGWHHHNLCRS